jgi:CRP-like cAMP-binding protein
MDVQVLRSFPFLSDFSDAELTDLFGRATEQHFAPGAFLSKEGERDDHLYFLLNGEVEIVKKDAGGKPHSLAHLGSGTLLGELAWVMQTPCTTTIKVLQDTSAIRLNGADLTQQLQAHSPGAFKLSTALLRLLAGRLLRMNTQFLESQTKANGNGNGNGHKKGEIERLRERILQDWSF